MRFVVTSLTPAGICPAGALVAGCVQPAGARG
jgi:hypothetical protein